jgi:hypothetical protein
VTIDEVAKALRLRLIVERLAAPVARPGAATTPNDCA